MIKLSSLTAQVIKFWFKNNSKICRLIQKRAPETLRQKLFVHQEFLIQINLAAKILLIYLVITPERAEANLAGTDPNTQSKRDTKLTF